MPKWIHEAIALLSNPWITTVVVAWLLQFSATQLVKVHPRVLALPDRARRVFLRTLSTALGIPIAWGMLPGEPLTTTQEVWVACAVGAAFPWVYKVGTAVLYRLFPWLEAALSAERSGPPGGGA